MKMAIEIVDLPINSMVIFHSYVNVYQRMTGWWCNNHIEKYYIVNGMDDNPYMKWKMKKV
jgi:hypothetical protein